MAEFGDRRVASLDWSNKKRVRSGKAPFAQTIETRRVTAGTLKEVWRIVECPYCTFCHAHVNKRHGTRVAAPCDAELDYILAVT